MYIPRGSSSGEILPTRNCITRKGKKQRTTEK